MRRILLLTVLICFSLRLVSSHMQTDDTSSNSIPHTLSIASALMVNVAGVNGTSFCEPNGFATASITGGIAPFTYLWNNGGIEAIITNLDAGTYRVTVTDATSTSATGSVSITNTYPMIVDASSTNETGVNANDGTATSSPTGGSMPYSFEWNNGSTEFMIVNLSPGVYTVTITDGSGCTASESVIVNSFGCPELSIGATVINPECFGYCNGVIQVQAIGNGVPPYSYLWSDGTISPTLTNLCEGTFSVTVVDDESCGVAETYVITEPLPLVPDAMTSAETAPSANDGSAWASPSGGEGPYTYLWSNSSTDSLITGLDPGMYTITVSDANSCSAIQTVSVHMFGCTILDGNIINTTCFESCDGIITVTLINPLPPVTYLWEDGSTQSSLMEICAGSYSVTATDASGCSASAIFTVTQPFPLNANTGNTDETAPDENDGTAWSVPIGGTPPYTYLWSNGSVDSLIIHLAPGIYFLTVTDANGCTDVDIANISQVQCIGSHTFTYVEPTCYESCNGNAIAIVSGTTNDISYLWSTGDTTHFITHLCEGAYSLTITNEDLGCSDDITFELHAPDSLELIVDQITHITDSTSASVSVHAAGGTASYSYQWSGPGGFTSNLEDLSGIGAGIYVVEIIDSNGCLLTDSIQIEDNSTVGISDPGDLRIRVYPNPARDLVYIDAYDVADYRIQLYSIDGYMLNSWQNVRTMDVSIFPEGIYALRIMYGKEIMVRKLVVIR